MVTAPQIPAWLAPLYPFAPRVSQRYLAKNLAHPMLGELRFWYEATLPRLVAAAP